MLKKKKIANENARNAFYDESAEQFFEKKYYAYCSACHEKHETCDVEFLNIEEDIQGRDIMEFKCPKTDTVQRSNVMAH